MEKPHKRPLLSCVKIEPDAGLGEPPKQSGGSSNDDSSDSDEGCQNHTTNVHNAIHRSEIRPAFIQEVQDELLGLNVDVYNQLDYERGVFDQVDRILDQDERESHENPETNTGDDAPHTDFRGYGVGAEKPTSSSEPLPNLINSDQQVLESARLERLRVQSLFEQREPSNHDGTSKQRHGKIPKLLIRINHDKEGTSRDSKDEVFIKKEKKPSIRHEPHETGSDKESCSSEYRPSPDISEQESEDDMMQDIDYESDDSKPHDYGSLKTTKRRKSRRFIEDDGDIDAFKARMKQYLHERAQEKMNNILADGTEFRNLDEMIPIEGKLRIPKDVWENLFEHQKIGVRWLWELHQLGVGGILGDEMGLGKTIQLIAFLIALRSSPLSRLHTKYDQLGPIVLVCPATVMHQWLIEFRKWGPSFRVAILHNTGNFSGNRANLVEVMNKAKGILIVSYPGVVIYQDELQKFDWHYAILDEGHKIRNPDAMITRACKRFRTPHRLILSGSPVQNNLKELWSIFDFIYPGKLGTIQVFLDQFGTPITRGGYANASDFQVQVAYKCTCVLRDTIKPFLLRRTKQEVNDKLKLPDKTEQVLFCKLTDKQRNLYKSYLESPTIRDIKRGMCQIFVGLIELRKICNHPDLFDATGCKRKSHDDSTGTSRHPIPEFVSSIETYGHPSKSGKMLVLQALLKMWKKQNHKVLLFTQSRQMLKIFEDFMRERSYTYLTLDGTTPIGLRQKLIDRYNKEDDIFVFLLTTRVGGVGVNLTSANRVVIFDPDWNPSTDIQARERAWRIGQNRQVIIYRLLTAGTIEEKIYHRQVFKLYLTNRILRDAKQKRFFKTNDLHELFTLGDSDQNIETNALFDDDLQINPDELKKKNKKNKTKSKEKKHKKVHPSNNQKTPILSDEKLQAMRERAKRLSLMIAQQYGNPSQSTSETTTEVDKNDHTQKSIWLPRTTSSNTMIHGKSKSEDRKKRPETNESGSTKKKIKYLVKQDMYKQQSDETEKHHNTSTDSTEDYILERLFKKGLSGALKHDQIECDTRSDYKIVQNEADIIARDAIRALRESRRFCLRPTFRPETSRLLQNPRTKSSLSQVNQPSTSSTSLKKGDSLLSTIKKRNQLNPMAVCHETFQSQNWDDEDQDQGLSSGIANETGGDALADKTRDFLLFGTPKCGEASTEEMLDFFKRTSTPDKTAIFKALLYEMCTFERRGAVGFWRIKNEIREIG